MVHHTATQNLDNVISAIADPTRRAILGQLARGPARISEVAATFPISLTGICKHVRVLEHAGLVHRTRKGRDNTLQLAARPLRDVARWLSQYEPFWNSRLDRLEKFFAQKKEKSK